MQEKYGFIYLWFDRKHKRYYIGSHWGTENDGYICSSHWMRKSFKRRPTDFKRRVIEKVFSDRKELLEIEHKWLRQIKDDELGKRYYNLVNRIVGYFGMPWNKGKKMIGPNPRKGVPIHSEETKERLRQINLGKKHSEETKKKMSRPKNRDYSDPEFRRKMSIAAKNRSIETRNKIAENNRRLQAEGKIGMRGKKHSSETIAKMCVAQQRLAAERLI